MTSRCIYCDREKDAIYSHDIAIDIPPRRDDYDKEIGGPTFIHRDCVYTAADRAKKFNAIKEVLK